MIKGIQTLFLLTVLLSAACAQKWTLDSETFSQSVAWPPQPDKPRLQHSANIRGFIETGSSAHATMRSIFFGQSETGKFERPVSVAKGADGRYAIADIGARAVHFYVPASETYIKIKKAGETELATPVSVIFDDELRLYISDSSLGSVFVYNKDGVFLSAPFAQRKIRKRKGARSHPLAAALRYFNPVPTPIS